MNKPSDISIGQTTEKARAKDFQSALIFGLIVMLFSMTEGEFMTSLGLGWTIFLFILFVLRLGKSFPVLELMLLMASLQWIFGPWISYRNEFQHFKYFMYVDEATYMGFVVPGVIAFSLGVLVFTPNFSFSKTYENIEQLVIKQPNLAYKLIAIGLVSTYIGPLMPAVIGFVFYLTASFQYVGLALLLFQPHRKSKWIWFILIMGVLAISSIAKGMFHDLLLWAALLSSFVIMQWNLKFLSKLSIIFLGVAVVVLLQSVKGEFRSRLGNQSTEERVALFTDLIQESVEGGDLEEDESLTEMASVRLNQGWIISSILFNMPDYEPFAEGETISEAFSSSLLPRFLVPDKKMAGGRDNFRRFTGLPIREDTSMGASIIGEAYANFGDWGAWMFMCCWGVFLAWGFGRVIKYGQKHPIIFVFIPLIFLQVIKAETELAVVLNHFVKSLILVFAFLWFARRFLKWQV